MQSVTFMTTRRQGTTIAAIYRASQVSCVLGIIAFASFSHLGSAESDILMFKK